jgi:hypothetical protein
MKAEEGVFCGGLRGSEYADGCWEEEEFWRENCSSLYLESGIDRRCQVQSQLVVQTRVNVRLIRLPLGADCHISFRGLENGCFSFFASPPSLAVGSQ